MSDDVKTKHGEAAWSEQLEATSRRNAETRRRGRAERQSHERVSAARQVADAQHEAEELRKLNVQIARGQEHSR
jgi:hypothetical protein